MNQSPEPFRVGQQYRRDDVYRLMNVPDEKQGGDWDTGYHRHGDDWFIFCAVGAAGRTGHEYGNHWDGDELVWRGKSRSKLGHQSIQSLISPPGRVLVFTREHDRDPFTFEGCASAAKTEATEPVTIHWRLVSDDTSPVKDELDEDIQAILKQTVESTTKAALIQARIGQGQFRTNVLGI